MRRNAEGPKWDAYSGSMKTQNLPNWIRLTTSQVLDFRALNDRGGGGHKYKYLQPEEDPMSEICSLAVGAAKFGISGAMSKDRIGPAFLALPNDIA